MIFSRQSSRMPLFFFTPPGIPGRSPGNREGVASWLLPLSRYLRSTFRVPCGYKHTTKVPRRYLQGTLKVLATSEEHKKNKIEI